MDERVEQLQKLAAESLGELTDAEKKVCTAAVTGAEARCGSANVEENDLSRSSTWGEERTIRASLIRWLCTSKDASPMVVSRRINISMARIVGELNLVGESVNLSLGLLNSAVPEGINVQDAEVRNLSLEGSWCEYLLGDRLNLKGNLLLRRGFKANGPVRLTGASISGDFDCGSGYFGGASKLSERFLNLFLNQPDSALVFDRSSIGGGAYLNNGFAADGVVSLAGAVIKGYFDLGKAKIQIGINMRDAQLRSVLFSKGECPYVIADRVDVKGSVFLREGFHSEGAVILYNSSISGDLDCSGAALSKQPKESALLAKAVKLFGKNIPPDDAFVANGSSIGGYVFLQNGFEAHGCVRFNGVNIGGNFVCDGGRFLNPGGVALSCQFTTIRGAAFFRKRHADSPPFQIKGTLDLFGSGVSGSMSFEGGEFLESEKSGAKLQNIMVAGALRWKKVVVNPATALDLSYSKMGQLEDDESSWPSPGRLKLDGFVYNAIAGIPLGSRQRKRWLESHIRYLQRQSKEEFSLQPYRQLADTLRRSGYEDNARQVLIEMYKARRKQGGLGKWAWVLSWILQYTIGFGYKSHRAFLWALLFVLVGAWIFNVGYENHLLTLAKTETVTAPPAFNSLGYSLDTFLPIINLRQKDLWIPDSRSEAGRWLQYYNWLHVGIGWVLITLGVAGFTGLVRRE